MRNKKIVFLVSSEIFYRNYINTGVIKFLLNEYKDIEILLREGMEQTENIKFRKYKVNQKHENRHFQYLKILSWRYRKLSRTFKFRFLRTSQFRMVDSGDLRSLSELKTLIQRNLVSAKRRLKIIIASNFLIFPITKYLFEFILKPDDELDTYLRNIKPDALIMPSSAYDPIVVDLINICRKEKIKSILLVDNWDNLSSKSILWRRPDCVGVWGEQTKEHAIEIQGFKDDQVSCIGTPRFEQYFEKRNLILRSHFDFEYVLFVGQSLPSDELRIVTIINDILCSSLFKETGIKLIYRPHPWAMDQNLASVEALEALEAVIIDPQITARDTDGGRVEQFQPNLDYYPSLLQNAVFVVSALTSMIIEASIFRKKVIAIAHNEPNNYTSPHRLLKEYRHFEDIEKLPNLSISHKEENFFEEFKFLMNNPEPVDDHNLDVNLNRFLNSEGTYFERLLAMLDEKI